MKLHVFNNPPPERLDRACYTDEGVNVWVTEVPVDFTDADVQYNVEKWAEDGDKVAKLAVELVRKHCKGSWFSGYRPRDSTRRCYVDE